MDSGINEGFANDIVVQAESSFNGSTTGVARHLPGRVSFSYTPELSGPLPYRNVWRMLDGDSFRAIHYSGTIRMEYSHGETLALLLSSLMKRTGTSPNYVFSAAHTSDRQSLAVGLSYNPNAQHFVFRGLVVEAAQFSIVARELVQVKLDFKAARLTTDGPLGSPVTETRLHGTALQAALEFDGADMVRAYESSFSIGHEVEMVNFGEDKLPTAFQPSGVLTVGAELAEWMGNTSAEGDRVASAVRGRTEKPVLISMVPGAGKLLELSVSRAIAYSGTPPGLQSHGIGYRAAAEAQTSEARTDRPVLTMTI